MDNTIRTFIAIDLDPTIRRAIEQIQDFLKKLDCHVKWVKPENIHLTLKFLGEVKLKKIDAIKQTMENILKNTESIDTELTQLGAFPSANHPRVLWAGLKDDERRIVRLAASLEEGLGKIGFKKEQRPFSPHITIGRMRSPRNLILLSKAISDYPLPAGLTQTIQSVTLYKSTLTPQGPIYEILEEFHFAGTTTKMPPAD